jgi:hypothetical protein
MKTKSTVDIGYKLTVGIGSSGCPEKKKEVSVDTVLPITGIPF